VVDVCARHNITVVGNGPTILLVHGFGCDQNLWRLVVDRLQSDFRLILIDLVGSGSSDPRAWDAKKYSSLSGYAADILEVVDALDLRDVVFVGHSVSAMIGALATIEDPRRFAKLVMLTPSPCLANYGYLWWLNRGPTARPGVPATAVSALGAGANAIWIDPAQDLVAVVRWIDKSALDGFVDRLLAAVR